MSDARIYPLTFTPVLRDYLWGGRRLESLYGRKLPPGIVAESWEISGHPNGSTVVDAGYWQGRALPDILAALGEKLVGTRAAWALERHKFPLLVKLLDAEQDLSVQVHPNDVYAQLHEHGELGKTEMWYVLHADPGAELILGLKPGATRAAFREAMAGGKIETALNRIPIRAGQAVDVPAGTVHALLSGTVVAEIQQNSDTTYRVYDWGRVGTNGEPRALHIEKALDVIAFNGDRARVTIPMCNEEGVTRCELVRNRYFVVEEVTFEAGAHSTGACVGDTLEIWGCVCGETVVSWAGEPVTLPAICWALLPAALGSFAVKSDQPSTCLRVYLPED